MKKIFAASAGLIVLLAVFFVFDWNAFRERQKSADQSEQPEKEKTGSGERDTEYGDDAMRDSSANDDSRITAPAIEWNLRPNQRLMEVLRSGSDYSSTLLEVADTANWTEKQLRGELIAFERACTDQAGFTLGRNESENRGPGSPSELMQRQFREFCSDFLQKARSKLEELDNVVNEEESLAAWQAKGFQDEAIGREAALDTALWDLREALDGMRYMAVVESVWILGTGNLLEPLIPEDIANTQFDTGPQNGVSIITFEAVAAALMCRRIGGCSANNPLLLQLCTLSVERPCYRPNSIFDAADQILTGFERQHFYHYLNQIEMLLVQRS